MKLWQGIMELRGFLILSLLPSQHTKKTNTTATKTWNNIKKWTTKLWRCKQAIYLLKHLHAHRGRITQHHTNHTAWSTQLGCQWCMYSACYMHTQAVQSHKITRSTPLGYLYHWSLVPTWQFFEASVERPKENCIALSKQRNHPYLSYTTKTS